MDWLKKETLAAWHGLLPQDVASFMEKPSDEGQDAADRIATGIGTLKDGKAVINFVKENGDSFIEMGRTRRVRFLAWLAARDYPDKKEVLSAISDGEGGGKGAGEAGVAAPYFLEDIRALVEALGPRAARLIVDAETLAAVKGAGYEVTSELEMRSGGSR